MSFLDLSSYQTHFFRDNTSKGKGTEKWELLNHTSRLLLHFCCKNSY